MTVYSPAEIAALAGGVGLSGDRLVTAVAIALGESGGDTDARGDTTLVDGKWGPSLGLWQVRSLNAQQGTGGTRDADRLTDPSFNAASMYAISNGGTNWRPWSVYTNGTYRRHLDDARAGVAAVTDPAAVGGADVQQAGWIRDLWSAGTNARDLLDDDNQRSSSPIPGGGVVDRALGPLDELAGAVAWLTSPAAWVRIGVGAAGVVLVLAGLVLLAREAGGKAGKLAGDALSLVPHPAAQAAGVAADVVGG